MEREFIEAGLRTSVEAASASEDKVAYSPMLRWENITMMTNLIPVPRQTHKVKLPQDRILHGRERVLNVVNAKETFNMLKQRWITQAAKLINASC